MDNVDRSSYPLIRIDQIEFFEISELKQIHHLLREYVTDYIDEEVFLKEYSEKLLSAIDVHLTKDCSTQDRIFRIPLPSQLDCKIVDNDGAMCSSVNLQNSLRRKESEARVLYNVNNNCSLKQRAKDAVANLKKKSLHYIDYCKAKQKEENKESRRKRAMKNIERFKMKQEERERKARLRKKRREKKEQAALDAMQREASEAVTMALASGKSPLKAAMDGAAAASRIAECRNIFIHDTISENEDENSDIKNKSVCSDDDHDFSVHINTRGNESGQENDSLQSNTSFASASSSLSHENTIASEEVFNINPNQTTVEDKMIHQTQDSKIGDTPAICLADMVKDNSFEISSNEDIDDEQISTSSIFKENEENKLISSSYEFLNSPHHISSKEDTIRSSEGNVQTSPKKIELVLTKRFPSFFSIFSHFHTGSPEMKSRRVKSQDILICQQALLTILDRFFAIEDGSRSPSKQNQLFFRISSNRSEVSSIICDALVQIRDKNWIEYPYEDQIESSWNLLWTWSRPKIDYSKLLVFQRVNHFPNSRQLTRKDLLKKILEKYKHLMMLTFILPNEYVKFVDSFMSFQQKDRSLNFWIVKPTRLSRGRGISITNDVCSVSYSEPVIVQKYLADPYLIDGYKFDLRIYVLVNSFCPLDAYIYREGFARFASKKYSSSPLDIEDERIHLTNSSIQGMYELCSDHPVKVALDEGGGNKVSLNWLWTRLRTDKIDPNKIIDAIDHLCLTVLKCSQEKIGYQVNSFELFGFDIILDQHLKPWLVEVNSSPSLNRENDLDRRIKTNLIVDVMSVINPLAYNRRYLLDFLKQMTHNGLKQSNLKVRKSIFTSEQVHTEHALRKILGTIDADSLKNNPHKIGHFVRLSP